jgi:hypothetical protein
MKWSIPFVQIQRLPWIDIVKELGLDLFTAHRHGDFCLVSFCVAANNSYRIFSRSGRMGRMGWFFFEDIISFEIG